MRNEAYPDAFLRDIHSAVKAIAVVVFAYLLARGYHVIGVKVVMNRCPKIK